MGKIRNLFLLSVLLLSLPLWAQTEDDAKESCNEILAGENVYY